MSKPAIILLSGGLDSATVLAIAKAEGFTPHALSFAYGQRHELELICAKNIAASFNVAEHKIAEIDLRLFGGSALTDDIAVPKGRDVDNADIPVTYVPARNTIFLSFALAYAEVVNAFDIFIGVNALDYSGYPDCRPAFIDAFAKMANLATAVTDSGKSQDSNPEQGQANKFAIHTPLIDLTKAEIIQRGQELGVDYGLTLSCYDPNDAGHACGSCDACQLRLRGFRENGITDPAIYQK